MKRLLALGVLAGAYFGCVRPRVKNAGSTREERERFLPGDDLVPDARGTSTMATTIAAPPEAVWPWLVQMGCNRAGWYSWDRLDNAGVPSADRIHPEWQELGLGDRLPSTTSGRTWFEVAALDPARTLVLRATIDTLRGRSCESGAPRPRFFNDSTWAFALEPRNDGSRLVVRGRSASAPRAVDVIANVLLWDVAHLIMQRRQFRNLKRRVEGAAAAVPDPAHI